jgi:tRNA(adenine34) deaminase
MNYHEKFMRLALEEAREALDQGEFPVGCVIASDGEVVAKGHRKNSRFFDHQQSANELDHAEITAIRNLLAERPEIDRTRAVAYSTMEPCLMCFATLILNNIHTIVYAYEDVMGGGTTVALNRLPPLYRQKKISVIPHILREESLALFNKFFSAPQNTYWLDSLLSQYTLEQQNKPRP